jgi:uncharacterized membrane protein
VKGALWIAGTFALIFWGLFAFVYRVADTPGDDELGQIVMVLAAMAALCSVATIYLYVYS